MTKIRFFLLAIAITLFPCQSLLAQSELMDLYYTGNYQEVISVSTASIVSGDTSLNTFHIKALAEAQLGQALEAIRTLQNGLTLHPGEKSLSRMLAGQYYEAGAYVKATESLPRTCSIGQ